MQSLLWLAAGALLLAVPLPVPGTGAPCADGGALPLLADTVVAGTAPTPLRFRIEGPGEDLYAVSPTGLVHMRIEDPFPGGCLVRCDLDMEGYLDYAPGPPLFAIYLCPVYYRPAYITFEGPGIFAVVHGRLPQ